MNTGLKQSSLVLHCWVVIPGVPLGGGDVLKHLWYFECFCRTTDNNLNAEDYKSCSLAYIHLHATYNTWKKWILVWISGFSLERKCNPMEQLSSRSGFVCLWVSMHQIENLHAKRKFSRIESKHLTAKIVYVRALVWVIQGALPEHIWSKAVPVYLNPVCKHFCCILVLQIDHHFSAQMKLP